MATIPACQLELSRNGSEVSHEYVMSPTRRDAQERTSQRRWQDQFFKNRDRNSDGTITLEEFIGNPKGRDVPALTKRFKKFDSNGDGKLHRNELNEQTK